VRLYIAGPMTGYPKFNIPAFDDMALALRRLDHTVISPAELDGFDVRQWLLKSEHGSPTDYPPGFTWGDFLARDVKTIADSSLTGVVVLPGWQYSRGARLETFVARLAGLDVMRFYATEERFSNVPVVDLADAWAGRVAYYKQPFGAHLAVMTK
jgi:hypothetical protein